MYRKWMCVTENRKNERTKKKQPPAKYDPGR